MSSQNPRVDAVERGEIARREKRLLNAEAAFTEAIEYFHERASDSFLAHALTRRGRIEGHLDRLGPALRDQLEALPRLCFSVTPALPWTEALKQRCFHHVSTCFHRSGTVGFSRTCRRAILWAVFFGGEPDVGYRYTKPT